jgi:hypothetical protein
VTSNFIEVDDMVAKPAVSEEFIKTNAKRRISGYFAREKEVK